MYKKDRTFKVLFGFNFEAAERAIFTNIEAYGLKVQGTSRYTKTMIRDYIKKNPDLDAVFLKEYLDGGEKFGALELSELADECDANFVVIMRSANKGREAMKILYCAGITGAVFADGKRGADPRLLAELAVKGRHNKAAREYYKVDAPMPDYGVLNFEDFRDTYSYLIGSDIPGSTIIDRFIDITRFLSPKQLTSFIKELPEDDLGDLMAFEEFYEITDRLRQQGYLFTKYKKPKKLMRAVDKDSAALVKDVVATPEYEKRPVLEAAYTSSAPDDPSYGDIDDSFEQGYAIADDEGFSHGISAVPSEEEAEIKRVKKNTGRTNASAMQSSASNIKDEQDEYEASLESDDYNEQTYDELEDGIPDEDSSYTEKDRVAYQTDDLLDISKVMYGDDAKASYEDSEDHEGMLSSMSIDDLLSKYQ